MKRRARTVKATAAALWIGVACALGPPTAGAEPVQLVTGPDYRPFTDPALPDGGLATAAVRAVYAHLDTPVRVSFRPWKRCYSATLAGRFTATFPYVRTERRAKRFYYSRPLFTLTNKPLVRADSRIRATRIRALRGRTTCQPKGYAAPDAVRAMVEAGRLRMRRPKTMTLCMRMLARGRVDFIAVNTIQGKRTARAVFGDTDSVRFLDIVLARESQHVIFPRNRTGARAAVDRFNRGLKAIRADGTLDSIRARFIGSGGA